MSTSCFTSFPAPRSCCVVPLVLLTAVMVSSAAHANTTPTARPTPPSAPTPAPIQAPVQTPPGSTHSLDDDTGTMDIPPLPSHPDVEPVGVPLDVPRAQTARAAAVPPDELAALPPPEMGLGELAGPLAKMMLMLGVVLLVVYLTLHKGLGKLLERQNLGRRVKVVERVALDQRRTLFLVDIDGKQMLLAAGEGGVVHLRDVDVPPRQDESGRTSPSLGLRFADALKIRSADGQGVSTGIHAATASADAPSKKA